METVKERVAAPAVTVGAEIFVYWGRFGRCRCKVHHIGKDGRVWAVRWMKKWKAWTGIAQEIDYVPYWRDTNVYIWQKVR